MKYKKELKGDLIHETKQYTEETLNTMDCNLEHVDDLKHVSDEGIVNEEQLRLSESNNDDSKDRDMQNFCSKVHPLFPCGDHCVWVPKRNGI